MKIIKVKCQIHGSKLKVKLPYRAPVLTIQNQSGTVYCYALSDGQREVDEEFHFLQHGAEVAATASYIATIKLGKSFHIFRENA